MPETPMEAAFLFIKEEFCKYGMQENGICELTSDQLVKFLCEHLPNFVRDPQNPNAPCPESAKKILADMNYPPEQLCTLDDFLDVVKKVFAEDIRWRGKKPPHLNPKHPKGGQDLSSTT